MIRKLVPVFIEDNPPLFELSSSHRRTTHANMRAAIAVHIHAIPTTSELLLATVIEQCYQLPESQAFLELHKTSIVADGEGYAHATVRNVIAIGLRTWIDRGCFQYYLRTEAD